jgi:hypothetical protein
MLWERVLQSTSILMMLPEFVAHQSVNEVVFRGHIDNVLLAILIASKTEHYRGDPTAETGLVYVYFCGVANRINKLV